MNTSFIFRVVAFFFLTFQIYSINGQNLSAGDIAFVGYNTDSPDACAWIALTDIPANEIIYFTEQGWTGSAWYANSETHITWTAPVGGLACGTVVRMNATGATSGSYTGTFFNLSAGDQVLAYQGNAAATANPTFIAGVHGDYNSTDYNASTTWNSGTVNNVSSCNVPTGLTNSVNCVSLFPAPGPEIDNSKYTGSLTGTASAVRANINNPANWSNDDGTAYSIEPSDFSPSVTCCPNLSTDFISVTENSGSSTNDGIICPGDNATLDAGSFSNYLWSTGETSQMISVTMTANYSLTLTDANGCTGEDSQMVTSTIPTVSLIIDGSSSVSETGGMLTYRFTRADCTSGNLTVHFSINGSATDVDFTVNDNPVNINYVENMRAGTVQFSGTDTTIDLEVNVEGDISVEENETIIVKIESSP